MSDMCLQNPKAINCVVTRASTAACACGACVRACVCFSMPVRVFVTACACKRALCVAAAVHTGIATSTKRLDFRKLTTACRATWAGCSPQTLERCTSWRCRISVGCGGTTPCRSLPSDSGKVSRTCALLVVSACTCARVSVEVCACFGVCTHARLRARACVRVPASPFC